MSTGFSKESPAMMRARELNRTNERRLSENIDELSLEVQKKMDKIRIEGETTLNFLRKVKMSSGFSQKNDLLQDSSEEKSLLAESPRRMDFSKVNYKKIKKISKALEVKVTTPAGSGNPIPVRKVHPWTIEAAKVLSRKSPSLIPHPTGRTRRHSVGSERLDNDSDDDDDYGSDITPLSRLKKRAGQKRLNAQLLRRTSLPTIGEAHTSNDVLKDDHKRVDKNTIQASLAKLKKKRSFSC